MKNLYELLEVSQFASAAQIKLAAQQRLQEIKDAYQTLADTEKRAVYDAKLKRETPPPAPAQAPVTKQVQPPTQVREEDDELPDQPAGRYVESVLIQGERVIHNAKLHWGIWIMPAIVSFFLGLPGLGALSDPRTKSVGVILLFITLVMVLKAIFLWIGTELSITNKRVIAKTGVIRRDTVELNLNKLESIDVNQGIIGRMLGFGTITVKGTGGTQSAIKGISNPLDFRRVVAQITG